MSIRRYTQAKSRTAVNLRRVIVDTDWSVIFQFGTRLCHFPLAAIFCSIFLRLFFQSTATSPGSRESVSIRRPALCQRRDKSYYHRGIRYSRKLIFKSTLGREPVFAFYIAEFNTRHRYFIIYLCVCICMKTHTCALVRVHARPHIASNAPLCGPTHRRPMRIYE